MPKKVAPSVDTRRQYRLLPSDSVALRWDDVPDALIVELVRAYTKGGDAILFGTSKAQDVLALRVYRHGEGYSTYSRDAEGLAEAVDRLYRMRPPYKPRAEQGAVSTPEAQGTAILPLPFHPKFSVAQLLKQRAEAEKRDKEWYAMLDAYSIRFDGVAKT